MNKYNFIATMNSIVSGNIWKVKREPVNTYYAIKSGLFDVLKKNGKTCMAESDVKRVKIHS